MSSGRLGPPRARRACRRRRKLARPPGPDEQVYGRADDRLLERLPPRAGVRRGRSSPSRWRSARASPSPARRCRSSAQPNQVLQRGAVDVPGHDRGHRRVTGDRLGGIPVQPGAAASPPVSEARARCAAHCARTCAVHSCCRAELPSSRSRSAREICAQTLTGCPARSGSRPGRGQAAHRLLQPVVVPLLPGPVVLRAGRGGQRIQHRRDDRRALRGQVPGQDARALERGHQPHAPVPEIPVRVLIGQLDRGPAGTSRRTARPGPAGPGPPRQPR